MPQITLGTPESESPPESPLSGGTLALTTTKNQPLEFMDQVLTTSDTSKSPSPSVSSKQADAIAQVKAGRCCTIL